MLDVTDPLTRLSMRQVAERMGKNIKTIYEMTKPRYAMGRAGKYLETAMFGGERYTTEDALKAFQVQGPPMPRQVPLPVVVEPSQESQMIQALCAHLGLHMPAASA